MTGEELDSILEYISNLTQQYHFVNQAQISALLSALELQGALKRETYEQELRKISQQEPKIGDLGGYILNLILDGPPGSPPKKISQERLREILTVHSRQEELPTDNDK